MPKKKPRKQKEADKVLENAHKDIIEPIINNTEQDTDIETNNEIITDYTMDNNFNNLSLVRLIIKWRWHILIITLVAAICGAIFSSSTFIKPLYKSEAVAYPANTSPLSEESRTEQMLQLLGSQTIADSIIKKHDLWSDYDIKPGTPASKAYMMMEYRNMIKISKTEYEAISIVAHDNDPEKACAIVNDILKYYDQLVHRLHHEKSAEVIVMYEKQLATQQMLIDSLKNAYNELSSQYGITDIGAQSREITKSYLSGSSKANELKENMETHASELIALQTRLTGAVNGYISVKYELDKELRFYNGNMTYSYIITEPYPADKKCYPVRWVIVAVTGISALLLSILALFVYENRKKFLPAEK